MVFYGVLDLLAKPVFCFYHCFALSKADLTKLHLSSGKYSESALPGEGGYYPNEKGERTLGGQAAKEGQQPRMSESTAVA